MWCNISVCGNITSKFICISRPEIWARLTRTNLSAGWLMNWHQPQWTLYMELGLYSFNREKWAKRSASSHLQGRMAGSSKKGMLSINRRTRRSARLPNFWLTTNQSKYENVNFDVSELCLSWIKYSVSVASKYMTHVCLSVVVSCGAISTITNRRRGP